MVEVEFEAFSIIQRSGTGSTFIHQLVCSLYSRGLAQSLVFNICNLN